MIHSECYEPGTFCWTDLATTDTEGAKHFYTSLFGWSASDPPAGSPTSYTILRKDGKKVCGLFSMREAKRGHGLSPYWRSYISVKNVNVSAAKVKGLRGTWIQEPIDAPGSGRMAVVADTAGAELVLWQAKQHLGAELSNEPGTVAWNELATQDADGALRFYTALFGWAASKETDSDGGLHVDFELRNVPSAGMIELPYGTPGPKAYWEVYFAVEDCRATARKAYELGGTLDVEPTPVDDQGWFSVIQDPQAGHFAIIQMNPEGDSE